VWDGWRAGRFGFGIGPDHNRLVRRPATDHRGGRIASNGGAALRRRRVLHAVAAGPPGRGRVGDIGEHLPTPNRNGKVSDSSRFLLNAGGWPGPPGRGWRTVVKLPTDAPAQRPKRISVHKPAIRDPHRRPARSPAGGRDLKAKTAARRASGGVRRSRARRCPDRKPERPRLGIEPGPETRRRTIFPSEYGSLCRFRRLYNTLTSRKSRLQKRHARPRSACTSAATTLLQTVTSATWSGR